MPAPPTFAPSIDRLEQDPVAARDLLRSAKGQSADALGELRGLVRGIRPPVLADRGLADALEALAVSTALPVTVESTLDHRLTPALESALYFATAELITNAAKHAEASGATVTMTSEDGSVTITVADDGVGGAERAERAGGGLYGVRRRLAPFDAELTVVSPIGGPTLAVITAPDVAAAER